MERTDILTVSVVLKHLFRKKKTKIFKCIKSACLSQYVASFRIHMHLTTVELE